MTQESHVPAGVPDDLRLAPVFPQAGDLLAWIDESVCNAGVDEPTAHRNARFHGQRGQHPADRCGRRHDQTTGVVMAEVGVLGENLDEVGDRNAEDGTTQPVVETCDQRRDVCAERNTAQSDLRAGLLCADPRQQTPDVPDSLGGGVDVVHDVFAREDRSGRQPTTTRPMHREDGQHDVEAKGSVEVPSPKHGEIDCGPTHLGAVYADQPGAVGAVTQHQRVAWSLAA